MSKLPKRQWSKTLTVEELTARNKKRALYYKERRATLMKSNPHCKWCGVKVIYFKLPKHQKMPANFATIDHIQSRMNGPRPNVYGKQRTLVLACHKYNQKRCDEEVAALSKWNLWVRSRAFPWYLKFMSVFYKNMRN